MYENCPVTLKMTRMIHDGDNINEKVYRCKVVQYNPENECIYILTGKLGLSVFSLDGVYECEIETETEKIRCTGMIRERYGNKLGKIIVLKVKNGFYKNSVK